MTDFLLDTNVVSIFSPLKNSTVSQAFADWRDEQIRANTIHISAVTIHEIEKGVHLLMHKGATKKAAMINLWLLGLIARFGSSIVPLDGHVAQISGQLEALAISAGYSPGAADAMIAGTAKAHDLTVITYNVKHFWMFDIEVLSPDQLTR